MNVLEIETVEVLHREAHIVAEGHLPAHRALGGDGVHFVDGKAGLVEDLQHLAADRAGGADHRDIVAHGLRPSTMRGAASGDQATEASSSASSRSPIPLVPTRVVPGWAMSGVR